MVFDPCGILFHTPCAKLQILLAFVMFRSLTSLPFNIAGSLIMRTVAGLAAVPANRATLEMEVK